MTDPRDLYQAYYQDKLWNLLPAIYRTLDTDKFNANGPLREMVNRIGAQAAVLRRTIDRLWEDQSIETCDDWVIAYIGDLLATNLVASLDARGQRIDVAKTIYYRRRKGTLGVLEEIAADITGWNARVVEFFRRMGRTRHNFDPEIGGPSALLLEEGLAGRWTDSLAGGWANLRNAYGALKSQTAFDEFSHVADFRHGVDKAGWHNIPHLGVFLWRLYSFALDQTTPVAAIDCPGQYAFDPTGREIPLFAAASRTSASYGDNWVSPTEWQVPGEIATPLMQAALLDPSGIPLYATADAAGKITPNSMGVFTNPGSEYQLVDSSHFLNAKKQTTIYPERGRFHVVGGIGGPFFVTYHYGFSSTIGAGPYDRRLSGIAIVAPPSPVSLIHGSASIPDPSPKGTIVIQDSLTYETVSDATSIDNVAVQAAQSRRPVLRLPVPGPSGPSAWTLHGSGGQSTLALEGLLVSGGDIVLTGSFASVTLTCCTLDPGNTGDSTVFAQSVDQRDLFPCRLWIEAEIANLTLDRCIAGPIQTRKGGSVETLTVSNSIIQGIRTSDPTKLLAAGDIQDPLDMALALREPGALAAFLRSKLDASTLNELMTGWDGKGEPPAGLINDLITQLNLIIATAFYKPALFAGIALSASTKTLVAKNPAGPELIRLNRLLLEEAYPVAFAQSALALGTGVANLTRTTVLGRAFVHRIEASECILDDFTVVEDTQHGCVRFTAWSQGSVLPRQYECVQIAPRSSIFTSRDFGKPGYGQLLASADAAILTPAGATIREGSQDGSEMGAFAREKNPIKERSILIKYQEYMPLGLAPVLVRVT
jgi:hypothetical protein